MEFPPRQVGRYRLIRCIGRGGVGEVYLAQFESAAGVRRLAAVKFLRDGVANEKQRRALFAEARLAALIAHPSIVQVYDADVEQELPWLAVEFVPGLSLSELEALSAGPSPPWVAARIAADLAGAAHAVHCAVDEQGRPLEIVHRDITPHNVLLSWDGVVKLADFGVARSSLQSTFTQAGVVKGKLGYMSPEQASGAVIDRRSDIFSIGIVLWELLAGRRLFDGRTNAEMLAAVLRCEIPELPESVPAALRTVVTRALARDPAERFASAQELERELEVALSSSGLVVGAQEIASQLARVAPERVREHERWVGEAPLSASTPPSGTGSMGATERTSDHDELASHARRVLPFPAWLAAGALLLALVVTARAYLGTRAPITPHSADPSPVSSTNPLSRESAPPAPVPSSLAPPAPASAVESSAPPLISAQAAPPRADARATSAPAELGKVNVSARPVWAEIRIDGKLAGSTPMVRELSAGHHLLEALPLGKPPAQKRQIVVKPDAATRVEFMFP